MENFKSQKMAKRKIVWKKIRLGKISREERGNKLQQKERWKALK